LDGGVGVQAFYLDQTIYDIGYFMQLNMFACAILCYMVGVNPFDQPGVESYKAKMREIIENS
jgi:glucose-6-phosphate isomerase